MKAKTIVAILAGLILAGPLAAECKADTSFTLYGTDPKKTVSTPYDRGTLYDDGNAEVVSGGKVDNIDAWDHSKVWVVSGGEVGGIGAAGNSQVYLSSGGVVGGIGASDNSIVNISGGTVSGSIFLYGESILNISDGSVNYIDTSYSATSVVTISGGEVGFYWALSPANISGGVVTLLAATGANTVAVSGGQVYDIYANDTSILTFDAQVLSLGEGLFRSGNQAWGVGELTGEWHGGTPFTTNINGGSSFVVPEPATVVCGLIGLGMIGTYIKKRRASKALPAHS